MIIVLYYIVLLCSGWLILGGQYDSSLNTVDRSTLVTVQLSCLHLMIRVFNVHDFEMTRFIHSDNCIVLNCSSPQRLANTKRSVR